MAENEENIEEKVEKTTTEEKNEKVNDSSQNVSETSNKSDTENNPVKEKSENRSGKNGKRSIYDITGDESLPEYGGDMQESRINSKLKQLQRRKAGSKKEKHKVAHILMAIIVVVGLILIFFTYKSSSKEEPKNLVMELPTFNINLYSESQKNYYNLKVNISLGLGTDDMKVADKNECYNIVYNTISNMDYDEVSNELGQAEIKEKISTALEEQTTTHIKAKVYISGSDLGMANVNGKTLDTNADVQTKKAQNVSNKTSGK